MSLSPCNRARMRRCRDALTLLELIVALGILAVLSTVAVQSLDPLADHARYEATQRLLNDLRFATAGNSSTRATDGQPLVSGFLADTGSLPISMSDFSTLPLGMIAYSVQTFDSDRNAVDDVSLNSGWRGPYLHLGAGQVDFLDGWGRVPLIDPDGGDYDFVSLGADNDSVLPEDGYDADLKVTILPTDYSSTVTFRIFAIDGFLGSRIDPSPIGTQQLGVLLYAINANGGTSGAVEELLLPVASSGSFEVSQSNFTHGRAAARAILWSDDNADDLFDVGESLVLSSYVHYFTVTNAADLRVEMELR